MGGIRDHLRISLRWFLAILVTIELGSVVRWLTYAILPSRIYGDGSWYFAELEMSSSTSQDLPPITPRFAILLWAYYGMFRSISKQTKELNYTKSMFGRKTAISFLVLSLALSLVIAIYPYLPTVNPSEISVSVDAKYYVEWVSNMEQAQSPFDSVVWAFTAGAHNGDRPIPLLVTYGLDRVLNNLVWVVRLLPMLLGPLLILSVFYLVKVGTKSLPLASIAGLFTVFSYHETIGLYAGFFANWFAIIFMYLFMAFLVSLWDTQKIRYFVAAVLSSTGILLSHSATWSMVMIGFGLFL